jgi:hypothetical protein
MVRKSGFQFWLTPQTQTRKQRIGKIMFGPIMSSKPYANATF